MFIGVKHYGYIFMLIDNYPVNHTKFAFVDCLPFDLCCFYFDTLLHMDVDKKR